MAQMAEASATGVPPMRALFMEYPDDPRVWEVEDQFLFGSDILVAPVTEYGARSREVYLPAGTRWRDAWTGDLFEGGQTYTMAAPLDRIPVLVPESSRLSLAAPEA
jgi:alpha-D-xyloside xylohydrolase